MKVVNDVFRPYLDVFVEAYLDDILIYNDSVADHLQHLRLVLQKLRESKLYAKLEKCAFLQTKVEFLGHVLSSEGITTNPKKIEAVVQQARL